MLTLSNLPISADFRKVFAGQPGHSLMTKKLSEAIIEKAADMMDNEVTCRKH